MSYEDESLPELAIKALIGLVAIAAGVSVGIWLIVKIWKDLL